MLVVLTETRLQQERAQTVAERLIYDGWVAIETRGYCEGILMLWHTEILDVEVVGMSEQEIDAIIEVKDTNISFLFSAIYASPRIEERRLLRCNLEEVTAAHSMAWVALGNFNEVLYESEKLGGRPICQARAQEFSEVLNTCSFSYLGFIGPRFRWSNL